MSAALIAWHVGVVATAGTLTCAGTVEMVVIHQPGFVGVKLSSMNDYALVCRVDVDYTPAGAGPITPNVCMAMYGGLLTAKAKKYSSDSLWFDGDDVPASCTGFGHLSQVNLRFLPVM